jgi:branched-chain amino acid transport system substrate-binding protein
MKKKIVLSFVAVILVVIVLLVVRGSGSVSGEIVVGATLPVTGNYAYKGESAQEGLFLAQDEINKSGGVNGKKIRVVVEDNKGEAKEAVLGVSKLLDVDGAKAIITSFSHIISAVIPIIKDKDAILIYASTVDSLTKQGENIFKDYYSTFEVGTNFALAARQEGLESIGVLAPKVEWGDEFVSGFTTKANEIGLRYFIQIVSPQATDFKTEILKFKQNGVDGLAIFSLQNNQILRTINDQGTRVRLFMAELLNDSITDDAKATEVIKNNSAISSWYYFDSRDADQIGSDFTKKYVEKFGKNPRADAAYSYDDLMLLRDVLAVCDKKEELNKQCLINNLKLVENYSGVSGTISFGSDRISNRPLKYYINKDGVWEQYMIDEVK